MLHTSFYLTIQHNLDQIRYKLPTFLPTRSCYDVFIWIRNSNNFDRLPSLFIIGSNCLCQYFVNQLVLCFETKSYNQVVLYQIHIMQIRLLKVYHIQDMTAPVQFSTESSRFAAQAKALIAVDCCIRVWIILSLIFNEILEKKLPQT